MVIIVCVVISCAPTARRSSTPRRPWQGESRRLPCSSTRTRKVSRRPSVRAQASSLPAECTLGTCTCRIACLALALALLGRARLGGRQARGWGGAVRWRRVLCGAHLCTAHSTLVSVAHAGEEAILGRERYDYTVRAVCDCSLYLIERGALARLLQVCLARPDRPDR